MKRFNHRFYLIAATAFLAIASRAGASPVGTANISNCNPFGGVQITATTITWLPSAGVNLGCIAATLPTSISFSGGTFISGIGTISDLPAGSTNPFMVLGGGLLDFSLSSYTAPTPSNGICSTSVALAVGESCIISVGSPFLLTSDATGTALSWITNGIATDAGNSSTSTYHGLFTEQVPVTTAQIAAAIDAGGTVSDTYAATLIVGKAGASAPEPSTLAFFTVALALVGIPRKRFRNR